MKSETMETLVLLVNDRGIVQWANNSEFKILPCADRSLVGTTLEDAIVRIGGVQQSIQLPDLESEKVIQHFDSKVRTSDGNLIFHWQVVRDRSSRSYFVIGSDYSDIRIGRRLVLDSRASDEIQAITGQLSPNTLVAGFYSYGEFSKRTSYGQGCELHNQTVVVTVLYEI